jgi:hypothetical protein
MANWYYKKDGEKDKEPVGPVSTSVLLQLVKDGLLNSSSLVRHYKNTNDEWARLKRIPGLLRRYQEGLVARHQRPAQSTSSGLAPTHPAPNSQSHAAIDLLAETKLDESAADQIELSHDELATHRLEAERLLNVAHAKSQVTKFQLDGQPQPIVARVVDHVSELLAIDETIEYIAVQAKQPPEMPDCMVLTSHRLLLVHFHELGQLDHEEYSWETLYEPRMRDGQPCAEFSLRALSGRAIVLDQIPRVQVKQCVRVAKEREEELRKRRLRREREAREAGQTEAPAKVSQTPVTVPPAAPTQSLPPHLAAKWKAVEELFEIGVISEAEVEEERRKLQQTAQGKSWR